jgi:hypothetical protein
MVLSVDSFIRIRYKQKHASFLLLGKELFGILLEHKHRTI